MNYEKHYNLLIEKAKIRQLGKIKRELKKEIGYIERHHILPISMGGTNKKDNLVFLTLREHIIAHLLLWKIYNSNEMRSAAWRMSHDKNGKRINSKIYEKLKTEFVESVSGGNHYSFGKTLEEIHGAIEAEEIRQKLKYCKKKTNDTIYNFTNIITNEKFSGTHIEFKNRYELNPKQLIRGNISILRNQWIIPAEQIRKIKNQTTADTTVYSFLNLRTKEEVDCTRIDFRRKYQLDPDGLVSLNSKNSILNNEWCLKNNIPFDRDFTIYTFRNIKTNEIFKGNRYEFKDKYSLSPNQIINKEYECLKKEWIICWNEVDLIKVHSRAKQHTFKNIITSEIFIGTAKKFKEKFNLNPNGLLYYEIKYLNKQWILIKENNDN